MKPPVVVALLAVGIFSCTFKTTSEEMPITTGSSGGAGGTVPRGTVTGGAGTRGTGACMNLQCQQTTCTAGNCMAQSCTGATTVSGTVYEPAGKVPLYNANVYIPNVLPLADYNEGVSCDLCDTALSGSPVTQATSDSKGMFRLDNVPVGKNIPLVIQIGKWRRQTTIPEVIACQDNPLTDKNLTRLPRNKSEGHLPRIALTTGGADALECLLRKIGIDDAEFTPEAGDGRVNLFSGGTHNGVSTNTGTPPSAGTNAYASQLNGGAKFTDAEKWWESVDNLKKYDIVLHSCEGTIPSVTVNKSATALAAMKAYADAGGRMFASHLHNYWLQRGPAPWPSVARFNMAADPKGTLISTIDTSFPKGIALSEWLVNVGASTTPGQLPILGARNTVEAVLGASQRWIYSTNPVSVQYFSFATPVGSTSGQCGKVVFSDLHVSGGSGAATDDDSDVSLPFPTGCRTTDLSPQEKALLFMLFDLSACIVPGIG